MKKVFFILSFILVSVVSFAQRQRTTAIFDGDTTTRPKNGFYGIGIRSNRFYLIPETGNNRKILEGNTHFGTSGQFLKTNSTANFWANIGISDVTSLQSSLDAKFATPTGLNTNYVTKWNGTALANSQIFDNGTNVGIGTTSPNDKFEVAGGRISISDGGGAARKSLILQGANNTDNYTRIVAYNYGTDTFLPIVLQDAGGNVGIGNVNPGFKLDLTGDLGVSTSAYLATTSGNVGIGTTSPTQKLHVNGNTRLGERVEMQPSRKIGAGLDFGNVIEAGSGYLEFYNSGTGNTSLVNTTEFAAITLHTNDTERFRILANGNVGIGTTTATQKLDVNGTTQATAFRLSANNTAPSSSTATCTTGEIRIDGNYIYYCSGTNTWKRATLNTY